MTCGSSPAATTSCQARCGNRPVEKSPKKQGCALCGHFCKRPGNTVLSRSADRREDGVRYGIGGHHGRSDTREWKSTGCTGASTATATHDRAEGGDCA